MVEGRRRRRREKRREAEESGCWNENGKLYLFFSPENMMNGDMRKAHYVHDDEEKNAFGCFKGITSKRGNICKYDCLQGRKKPPFLGFEK